MNNREWSETCWSTKSLKYHGMTKYVMVICLCEYKTYPIIKLHFNGTHRYMNGNFKRCGAVATFPRIYNLKFLCTTS